MHIITMRQLHRKMCNTWHCIYTGIQARLVTLMRIVTMVTTRLYGALRTIVMPHLNISTSVFNSVIFLYSPLNVLHSRCLTGECIYLRQLCDTVCDCFNKELCEDETYQCIGTSPLNPSNVYYANYSNEDVIPSVGFPVVYSQLYIYTSLLKFGVL